MGAASAPRGRQTSFSGASSTSSTAGDGGILLSFVAMSYLTWVIVRLCDSYVADGTVRVDGRGIRHDLVLSLPFVEPEKVFEKPSC